MIPKIVLMKNLETLDIIPMKYLFKILGAIKFHFSNYLPKARKKASFIIVKSRGSNEIESRENLTTISYSEIR